MLAAGDTFRAAASEQLVSLDQHRRYRRNCRRMRFNIRKINISAKVVRFITMHSYIDDNSSPFDIFRCDKTLFSNCNNQDICSFCYFFKIFCSGMCNGYSSVFTKQKGCHWFTDDIASSNDHTFFSFD